MVSKFYNTALLATYCMIGSKCFAWIDEIVKLFFIMYLQILFLVDFFKCRLYEVMEMVALTTQQLSLEISERPAFIQHKMIFQAVHNFLLARHFKIYQINWNRCWFSKYIYLKTASYGYAKYHMKFGVTHFAPMHGIYAY